MHMRTSRHAKTDSQLGQGQRFSTMQMSVFRDVSTMQLFVLCADDFDLSALSCSYTLECWKRISLMLLTSEFCQAPVLSSIFSSTGSVNAFLHLVIVDNGSFDIDTTRYAIKQEADDASPANNKHWNKAQQANDVSMGISSTFRTGGAPNGGLSQ